MNQIRKIINLIAVCVISINAYAQNPLTLSLPVVIRDFSVISPNANPDFQSPPGGSTFGAVDMALGANGKPVFTGVNRIGFTNATNFNKWFNDDPLNKSQSTTITLSQSPNGYIYDNASFYPIDGQLWGNDNMQHNYNFTVETHARFTYHAANNINFEISSDDDAWLFINGKLAIDLGGIHGTSTGAVTLNNQVATTLGLIEGKNYSFDLFKADRGPSVSAFKLRSSVILDSSVPNTTITSTPAALTASKSATFTFTSNADAAKFKVSVDGAAPSIQTSPFTISGLNNGSHSFSVSAFDFVGQDPTPAYFNWTVDQTLPVELVEFTATKQANNIKLSWITLSENNNKGFLVQKSIDGKTFTDLAFVNSKSTQANNYTLVDNNPVNGANYYRLVQQDTDGKEIDLGIKVVNFALTNVTIKAWPNPVNRTLNLSFEAGKYHSLELLDITGKKLQEKQFSTNESQFSIDMGSYSKGIYMVEFKGKQDYHVLKILK